LNTGCSMTRYMKKIEDAQSNFKVKPNETFKRITLRHLAELTIQVAEQELISDRLCDSQISDNEIPVDYIQPPKRSYTTLSDVISGTGAKNFNDVEILKTDDTSKYINSPLLLLDCQTEDMFNNCHIRSAVHLDSSILSRTMNPYTQEMRDFMDRPDKIIVVYDENEETSYKVATFLSERNISNIFLLSGGLKLIAKRGLHELVTGPYPKVCFREEFLKKEQNKFYKFAIPGHKFPVDNSRSKFTCDEVLKLKSQLNLYTESIAPSTTRSTTTLKSSNSKTKVRSWR